jgi:hypothetical protein
LKRAEKKKKKNPGINPGQPAGKGRQKKTLVLTLGSPPEKGEEKKKPGINLGQVRRLHSEPARKGRKKKQKKKTKKTPSINPGQPARKGRGKKNPGQTAGPRFQDLVLSVRRGPEIKIDTWTDRQTDRHHVCFNI